MVQSLLWWIDTVNPEAPRRIIPVILKDLSDQFGLAQASGGVIVHEPPDRWIGPHNGFSHEAEHRMKKLLRKHDFCAVNAFVRAGGPAFFRDEHSSIDHIFAPVGRSPRPYYEVTH